ncbi:MAG: VCBS repeat-containing protein [Planctomycetes bacterium]|nr:VCBS repeat-containing protein [Planctomycetota bacterium]
MDLIGTARDSAGNSVISVLTNNGNRRFSSPTSSAAGRNLYAFALGDLDGDGDLDAVTANGDQLLVLANDGNSAFNPPASYPSSSDTRVVIIGEVTGDALPDLIAVNRPTDTVSVLKNTGAGVFSQPVDFLVGDSPNSAAAGDFDGDQDLDLATANSASRDLSVLKNDGSGRFGPPASYPIPQTGLPVVTAKDVNSDGAMDLLVLTPSSIAVYLNGGDGTFSPPVVTNSKGTIHDLADFDRDGDPDLAIGTSNLITVRFNDGAGKFGVSSAAGVQGSPQSMVARDFDGDRAIDVAFVGGGLSKIFVVWSADEGPSFSIAIREIPLKGCADPRGCRPHSGSLADFDGDGDLDFSAAITHPGSFYYLQNEGHGNMVVSKNFVFGGEHPQSVAVGDVDGDGDVDAATVDNLDHSLYIHLNKGSGSFFPPKRFPVGSAPINVQFADFDGDGDLDAASANQSSNNISVLFNQNDGTFKAGLPRDYRVQASPIALATVDLDQDGDMDLAVANSTAAKVTLLVNDGKGNFPVRKDLPMARNPHHVIAADFNGDRNLDLATANMESANVTIFMQNGGGAFQAPKDFPAGGPPYSVVAMDFDGDGRLDLVTGNEATNNVSILFGIGNGAFQPPLNYAAGTGLRFVFPGDLDGDQDIDLITNNREGHSLSVLENKSSTEEADYLEALCTPAEFHRFSASAGNSGPGDRFVKFLLPVKDGAALLPTLYQNTRRFLLHPDFLRQVFPDRFPALTAEEYEKLVGRRATRQYFVGSISRIVAEKGLIYGFNIYADFSDLVESLRVEEVRDIFERLSRSFHLRPIAYFPGSPAEAERAQKWQNPGFPIYLGGLQPSGSYEAYTTAAAYGRVRLLSEATFNEANNKGLLSFQDILILERAPRDIEGVVGGVITAEPQGELSHVAVRTARRGTPNAFVAGALELFASLEGKLVRLEVRESGYEVREASQADAERWWAANRPSLSELPALDAEFRDLNSLDDLDLSEERLPPEARFGGKAANLARLQRILEGPWSRYREKGFAIPMSYYLEFMRSNRILSALGPKKEVTYEDYLKELFANEVFLTNSQRRFELLKAFQKHVEDKGEVSDSLVRQLAVRIFEVFGSTSIPVRFRSSSNVEDVLEFNGAGLYDSTTACAADDLDVGDTGPSRCDPTKLEERGIARALKLVWGSLWNYRAFEEREYYGIPQELAAMGILVTQTFTDESANGVAFTGNPANLEDNRYVVIAQLGETSVVSPDPGILAEKDLLEIVDGKVARIIRTRSSSLLPEGKFILSEAHLEEFGLLLWHIDRNFPVQLGKYRREQVLLDLEFKIEAAGTLAVKQVRPFLRTESAGPSPTFELEISSGASACGAFSIGREPRAEYELKSVLKFTPGRIPLPTKIDTFPGNLLEEVRIGKQAALASPKADGLFQITKLQNGNGRITYRFTYEQEFRLAGGESFQLNLSLIDYQAQDGEPVERTRILGKDLLVENLLLQGSLRNGEEISDLFYSSCAFEAIPLWVIRAELEDGSSFRLEERFRPEPQNAKGPASLTRAEVIIGGQRREVSDYWHLVYSAARHNEHIRHWVVFDPPVVVAVLGQPVHAVELVAPEEHEGIRAEANYLGEQLQPLAKVKVLLYQRDPADAIVTLFRRGDAVPDGSIELADAIAVLNFLFLRGEKPACAKAADANDDGRLTIGDAVITLQHLLGGRPLPAPFAACGSDPTADSLTCDSFPLCTP